MDVPENHRTDQVTGEVTGEVGRLVAVMKGEMKARLDMYLSQLTAGKDPSKIRIVLQ